MFGVRAVLKSEIIKVFSFELPLSLFTSLFFLLLIYLKGFFFFKDPVHKTESEGSGSINQI